MEYLSSKLSGKLSEKKCLGTVQRVLTKYLQTNRNVGDPDYCITNYNGIGGVLAYSLAFALHLLVSVGLVFVPSFCFFESGF